MFLIVPDDIASPWADQTFLRNVQYRSDINLALRQSIYAYQRPRLDLAAAVIDLLGLGGTEIVADIGCGNGAYLAELERRRHDGALIGIDLSPGMLAAARDRSRTAYLLAGDASALPLRAGSVEIALAMHMLYHVPEPGAAVAELRRVTRAGGQAVVGLNGAGHLLELRDLIDDSLSDAGLDRSRLPGERITLEQGKELLAGNFSSVVRYDFTGELWLPGPEPVADYARSTIATWLPHEADQVISAITSRLVFDHDGIFRVRTHGGCLICT